MKAQPPHTHPSYSNSRYLWRAIPQRSLQNWQMLAEIFFFFFAVQLLPLLSLAAFPFFRGAQLTRALLNTFAHECSPQNLLPWIKICNNPELALRSCLPYCIFAMQSGGGLFYTQFQACSIWINPSSPSSPGHSDFWLRAMRQCEEVWWRLWKRSFPSFPKDLPERCSLSLDVNKESCGLWVVDRHLKMLSKVCWNYSNTGR